MSFEAALTTAYRDTELFVLLLSPSEFSGPGGADSMIFQRKHRHSDTPDVYVFEAESHKDIRVMIDYWKEAEFDIHPALDLAASFRQQGMKIAKRGEDARENWSKRRSEASNGAGWQICLIPICIPRYAMVAIVLPP